MLDDYNKCFQPSPQVPAFSFVLTPVAVSASAPLSPLPTSAPQIQTSVRIHTTVYADDEDEIPPDREDGEVRDDDEGMAEWDDYQVQTPSPSPVTPGDSPPVDIVSFHQLMDRAAQRFKLPRVQREEDCFLYDFKNQPFKQVHTVPIIDFIWAEGVKLMQTPNSLPAKMPRLENKYKAPVGTPACLIGQPKPDLVVTQAAQRCSRNPASAVTAPPDREGRRLDAIDRKFSSMASTTVRAANALAILGRYDRQMWADMSAFVALVPDASKAEALQLLQEGQRTSEEIDCAVDIACTGFRQLAGAAVLRRQDWLRSTSFPQEVQAKILDMPYDG
ncbi:uncharacterized protein LOC144753222 [Lissotriton helveticus]